MATGWLIRAGGAHSVTRASMAEALEGGTYPRTALAADVRVPCGLPRDSSNLAAGPEGHVPLAPLPDERWITFVGDLDDAEARRVATATASGAVAAAIDRRVPGEVVVDDVVGAAPLRTHQRVASRRAQGRRILLGDAGHLPSPFGGEGPNSGRQDAHDIAWKLALVLRGRGRAQRNGGSCPLFGAKDGAVAARLARRWGGLVDVVRAAGDPRAAGPVPPGAILVGPDGHVGCRAAPADAEGLAALDTHPDS